MPFFNVTNPIPIPPIYPVERIMRLFSYLAVMLFVLFLNYLLKKTMKQKFKPYSTLNWVLSILISMAVLIRFGISMTTIKGIILFFCLLYASNSDLRTREVSDVVPMMIFISSFIDLPITDIPTHLLGAIIITLPQLVIAMIKPDSYGGADIKIMAACSFLLGLEGGLIALMVGLSVGLIMTVILKKINIISSNAFPVIPYLSFGSFLVYLFL